MTGGIAVVLGRTGKNFAAGMSGGAAYVFDEEHVLYRNLSSEALLLKEVKDKYDIRQLTEILSDYVKETGSPLAKEILADMDHWLVHFKKIIPVSYQRILERITHYEEMGLSGADAKMEAFLELSREQGGS